MRETSSLHEDTFLLIINALFNLCNKESSILETMFEVYMSQRDSIVFNEWKQIQELSLWLAYCLSQVLLYLTFLINICMTDLTVCV